MYAVKLEQFEGPLDLLLSLIEQEQMDITQVSLAKVANSYIEYINQLTELNPEEVADFLVVASKLIYIKSKALLPTLDLEDEGLDLEIQLKMYKEFVEASKKIHKIVIKKKLNFVRTKFPADVPIGFNPPKNLTASKLQHYYSLVLNRLRPLIILPKKLVEKTVTISEKINYIKDLIYKEASISFCRLLSQSRNKTEKIVSFLALLELVKQKIVWAEQTGLFEDIMFKKNNLGRE